MGFRKGQCRVGFTPLMLGMKMEMSNCVSNSSAFTPFLVSYYFHVMGLEASEMELKPKAKKIPWTNFEKFLSSRVKKKKK